MAEKNDEKVTETTDEAVDFLELPLPSVEDIDKTMVQVELAAEAEITAAVKEETDMMTSARRSVALVIAKKSRECHDACLAKKAEIRARRNAARGDLRILRKACVASLLVVGAGPEPEDEAIEVSEGAAAESKANDVCVE